MLETLDFIKSNYNIPYTMMADSVRVRRSPGESVLSGCGKLSGGCTGHSLTCMVWSIYYNNNYIILQYRNLGAKFRKNLWITVSLLKSYPLNKLWTFSFLRPNWPKTVPIRVAHTRRVNWSDQEVNGPSLMELWNKFAMFLKFRQRDPGRGGGTT